MCFFKATQGSSYKLRACHLVYVLPEPDNWHRRRHEHDPHANWDLAGQQVLQRVRVDRGCGDGGSPLVVLLVDVLVNQPMMQKPVQVVEETVVAEHADEQDLESVVDVRDESEIVHAVGVVAAEGHHPGRDAQQEVELHGQ